MRLAEASALKAHGYLQQDGYDELSHKKYDILEGRNLLIGRDHKTCDIVLTDPTISNQHLQLYTTIYNEDNCQLVFTYAKDLSTNGSYWRYKYGNDWNELLIGRGKAVLLCDGDRIRLCNGSSFEFRTVSQQCSEEAGITHDEDIQLFKNLFRVMNRILGSGAYGEVWMAVDVLNNRQMACKIVKLRSRKINSAEVLWREVDLLKDISHPNILRVERVFFTEDKLYIISDLVTGGDLMSYLERPRTKISDTEACVTVYQILKGLEYLHGQGICHRDLKPENILMSTPMPGARVIVADFGHSVKLSSGKQTCWRRMKSAGVGTDYYVAPEVRGKRQNPEGYTMATDMWSLGIISTMLLTGKSVFESSKDESASSVLNAAAECDLTELAFSPSWQNVSKLANDLVRHLLVLDEKARLNVEQALEHVWFTDDKRREFIQHRYKEAIEGWMPSRPLLDFKEDLARFRQASKSTPDVRPYLQSILMPPPARPSSKRFLSRPTSVLENGQRSSPFFSVKIRDDAADMTKKGLESDDYDADKPSILQKPAITTDQRQNNLSHGELSDRVLQSSIELDYLESRLYDRVSREEASTFRSAKSYRQSVEKRRRLGY